MIIRHAASLALATGYRLNPIASALLCVTLGIASSVLQQTARAEDAQDVIVEARQRFNIPAGSLDAALTQFGTQSGLLISVDSALTTGKRSAGVQGEHTALQALQILLTGSGLTTRFTGANTVTLQRIADSGPQVLDPISVEAEGRFETAYGPDDGYVVTRSATGAKTDTPLNEIPQSISVVTRERLEDFNPINIGEALRYTPGINTQSFGFDSRFDFFEIRGFSGTANSLFRDGLQLRSPGFRQFRYDPYGLERIEVLRGPASVLYGQGNPGGIVNFVTKRPTAEPFRELIFEPGNFDHFQGKFDFSGPIDEAGKFAYRLTGLARDSETQVDFVDNDRLFIAPSFSWKPSVDTSFTFLTHFEDDSTGSSNNFFPASGTLQDNPNGRIPVNRFTGEPDFDKYERTEYSVGYLFEHRANDIWTVRQNARYDHVDVETEQIFGSGLDPDDPSQRTLLRGAFAVDEKNDAFSVDNQIQADFETFGFAQHTLLFGIDYQRYDFTERGAFGDAPSLDVFDPVYGAAITEPPLFSDNDGLQQQVGLYLQEQLKLFDQWVVTLGGRQDYVSTDIDDRLFGNDQEQDDSEFSGRVGVAYLAGNGLTPYVSYSESFLPVAGTDFFSNAFEPETGEQYEVGLKYQPPGGNSFVTVAAFDLTRQNVLTPDPDPDRPFSQVQTGEVRSRGIELEGVADFDFGLNLILAYTYQDLEITESNADDEGNRPGGVPEHLASFFAGYAIQSGPLSGLGFGTGIRYTGSEFATNANDLKIDDFTLVDASAYYDWKNLRFSIKAGNVFDNYHVSSCSNANGCFLGPARTVVGSVRYRW